MCLLRNWTCSLGAGAARSCVCEPGAVGQQHQHRPCPREKQQIKEMPSLCSACFQHPQGGICNAEAFSIHKEGPCTAVNATFLESSILGHCWCCRSPHWSQRV